MIHITPIDTLCKGGPQRLTCEFLPGGGACHVLRAGEVRR